MRAGPGLSERKIRLNPCRLSVITPCYNSEKTIEDTLNSVLNQHYDNIEHIIIDGASSDKTVEIVEKYKKKAPYKVTVVSEPDNGIYDAMNKGIGMASGDLVGIVNSDDWYEENAFEEIIGAYNNNEYEIIYGMIRLIDEGSIRSIEFYHHDFLLKRMINHPGCFVTLQTYRKVGLFDTAFRSSADYAWMKKAMDDGAVFTPVYKILANVRTGGMSSSNRGFRETLRLQYEWGQVSKPYYLAYDIKSRIGDILHGRSPK